MTYALLGAAVGAADGANPVTLLPLAIGILLATAVTLRTRARLRRGAFI